MPLGTAKNHIIFGENADKTLETHQKQLAEVIQALHKMPDDRSYKYSRKHGLKDSLEANGLPFSIMKTMINDKARYFALDNHQIDKQMCSQKVELVDGVRPIEGVGGDAYCKPMRELFVSFTEGGDVQFEWQPISVGEPTIGMRRNKGTTSATGSPDERRRKILEGRLNGELEALQAAEESAFATGMDYQCGKEGNTIKYALIMPWFSKGDVSANILLMDPKHAEQRNHAAMPCWTIPQVYQLLEAILQLVVNFHAKHWVHRDLKLENICLDANRKPHLVDFGMAKKFPKGVPALANKVVAGTLAYLPPEVAEATRQNGLSVYSYKSDAFSLGKNLEDLDLLLDLHSAYRGSYSETAMQTDSFSRMIKHIAANMQKENLDERWTVDQALACVQSKRATFHP
ncbi:MAG: hypothetical protein DHS20C10_07940 [marine bacterium B5-7]|nr:MAG: hypothetical protein DHS20C10_07940 [marine bacterium B5-7]